MPDRPYQARIKSEVLELWGEHQRVLCSMATGTGKTHVFVGLGHHRPGRALVLAHTDELIKQAAGKIELETGYSPGVEKAELRVHDGMFGLPDFIVSSIQTQAARGADGTPRRERFNPMDFATLIIDEAHRACSRTYRETIDYYCQNPKLRVLGVTATPDRGDGKALGRVFTAATTPYSIQDGIQDGWLVPLRTGVVYVDTLNLAAVGTVAGDFASRELEAELEDEKTLRKTAAGILAHTGDGRSLVFTRFVPHAEMMSAILNASKPGSSCMICGKTPKDQRPELFSAHKCGDVQYLCNVAICTEGYDDPEITHVCMTAPTKSRARYTQMVGRVTRPLRGIVDGLATAEERRAAIAASAKPYGIVIDLCGVSGDHSLICTADVLGGDYSDDAKEEARRRLGESREVVDMTALLDTITAEQAAEAERLAQMQRRAKAIKIVSAKTRCKLVDPFTALPGLEMPERKSRAERRNTRPPEASQIEYLQRAGIDAQGMSYATARAACLKLTERRREGLATPKQVKHLALAGYDTARVTFDAAKVVLDAVFAAPRGCPPPVSAYPPEIAAMLVPQAAPPPTPAPVKREPVAAPEPAPEPSPLQRYQPPHPAQPTFAGWGHNKLRRTMPLDEEF